MSITNVLSVDLEEYFHATEAGIPMFLWPLVPSRVELVTQRLLELLASHCVKATFFVLGWVAHHYPHLIREIAEAGHEIGCHGYEHRLIYELTPAEFRQDTERAVLCIRDACGVVPHVYRAASYSITRRSLWALDVLTDCGFTHDSSIYPIVHDRYGIPGFGRHAQVVPTVGGHIVEVPISTVKLADGQVAPVGGGAYLRLFPYRYTAAGLRRINQRERQPACIYLHPWEIDPGQPRLARGLLSRIRTQAGLGSVEAKVRQLLSEFRFSTLTAVHPAVMAGQTTADSAP